MNYKMDKKTGLKVKVKAGYVVFFHPFEVGADNANVVYEEGLKALAKLDLELISGSKEENIISDVKKVKILAEHFRRENVDAIIIRLATWCNDDLLLDLIAICDVPIVNWGLEDINSGSMCGAQQFNAVLKELNHKCIFAYKDTPKTLNKIKGFIYAVAVVNRLKNLTLGIAGNRTQGMAEVIFDEFSLKEIFGVRIRSIKFEELEEESHKDWASDSPTNELINEKKELLEKNYKIEVNGEDLEKSLKNYLVLKKIIEKNGLKGITIDCYPLHMGEYCLAFSLLSSEGFSCACEGDVNSLVLVWIMQNLSGMPTHHIDPLQLKEEENALIGSHCGSGAVEIAEDPKEIKLTHVRLANKGVCIQFPSKTGEITMANLIGRKGTYRMAIITGKAIKTTMEFPGNPIKIQFPFELDRFLDLVEIGGFGHHWVVAYGDISRELIRIAEMLNIKYTYFNTTNKMKG